MKWLLIVLVFILGVVGLWPTTGVRAQAQSAETTLAASQSATFAIENMTCALCPMTVRMAMESVTGVESVSIDFEKRTATVVFDPAVTDTAAIAAASSNAGYPAATAGS